MFKRDGEHVAPRRRRRRAPKRIFEIRPIRWLLEHGTRRHLRRWWRHPDHVGRRASERTLTGVEAVIDKDLASELLAREVDADLFVMATDVDGVYDGLGHAGAAAARAGDARRAASHGLRGRVDGAEGRRRGRSSSSARAGARPSARWRTSSRSSRDARARTSSPARRRRQMRRRDELSSACTPRWASCARSWSTGRTSA